MAGSLNRVELIGRLTRDPQLRTTPNGSAVCNLGLATNWYGRGDDGQTKENTDFHDIVVWNQGNRKLADIASKYLSKGRLVYIEGRLRTRSWDDQQTGQKRYKVEIVATEIKFLESRGQQEQGGGQSAPPQDEGGVFGGLSQAELDRRSQIDPDDIPF